MGSEGIVDGPGPGAAGEGSVDGPGPAMGAMGAGEGSIDGPIRRPIRMGAGEGPIPALAFADADAFLSSSCLLRSSICLSFFRFCQASYSVFCLSHSALVTATLKVF